ncbi:MAG: MATE family efflux transporter, partial [Agathobacter rectalis]
RTSQMLAQREGAELQAFRLSSAGARAAVEGGAGQIVQIVDGVTLQDIKALDDIFALAIRICGIVSVLFFVACAFFPRYLMLIFTNEPVLIDYGVSYLKIASFSYLLTGFSQCYIVMMKISEHAGTAAAVSSITVLINIMLNAIFIYGAFGIESMNVRGAALATLISRVVELMLSITFSYRPGYIRLKIRELFARNKELSADFMRCSGPILGAS